MTGLEWFFVAVLSAALIGIAAAVIHSLIWPVDTAKASTTSPV